MLQKWYLGIQNGHQNPEWLVVVYIYIGVNEYKSLPGDLEIYLGSRFKWLLSSLGATNSIYSQTVCKFFLCLYFIQDQ